MTADSDGRPLSLAFLGDPNSIHVRRWMAFFLSRGHDVHLILAGDSPLNVTLDDRLMVHRLPAASRSWRRLASFVRRRRALRRILVEVTPDVLHAHYLTSFGWMARLSGFHPYVITVWGSDIFVTPRASMSARFRAWATLRSADLVTADSVDLGRSAVRLGARADHWRLIQFGVDTERFRPGLDPSGLRSQLRAEGRRVIFAPRSIKPLYRTLTVVMAMRSLPEDCLLLLTEHNHDDRYLAAVRSQVAALGLQDRVRIVASVNHERMPAAYALADVIVSIPATDGTPVSVLEAMSCGRLVVATDVPSVREWLGDLAPWALVPVDDEARTAEAIRRVLELDRPARADLSARYRERVASRADYQANMLTVEREYRSLASE